MSDLPISAALHAPAATAQASAAPSEQAERAGAAPSGAESFKAALRKELGLKSDAPAPTPSPPVPQEDLATDAKSLAAAEMALAVATADATLAMLLHAQADVAAARPPVAQSVQLVLSAVLAGSPASPRVDPTNAAWPAVASQEASQAKPGSIEPGWMAGAARKAVFDLAAAASPTTQPSLADGRQSLSSRLTGFAMPGDGASVLLGAPRQEFRLDASVEASSPVTTSHLAPSVLESSRPQGPTVVQAQLHARVGDAHWDQGLGERLIWMAGQRQQVAQLHLNPPDLGPLTITLTLERDQASAQFVCAQPAVREAIEAALPRLRDMLAESGITLGNVDVGAQAFPEPTGHQERAHRGYPGAAQSDPDVTAPAPPLSRGGVGLVDTFA